MSVEQKIFVQETLKKHLRENETLLAFTAGHLASKGHNTCSTYLGLTEEYLIFYIEPNYKNPEECVLRIHRSFIRSMSWFYKNWTLTIKLLKDKLYISSNINWATQIDEFIKKHKNTVGKVTTSPKNEKTELLVQIQSLYELNCLRTAKSELKKGSRQSIFLKYDPDVKDLKQILLNSLLSLRLASLFIFIISILVFLSAVYLKNFLGVIILITSIPAAFMLFLEDQTWRRLGNLTAILTLINYSILGLFSGKYIAAGIWIALSLPVLVLLNTKPNQSKFFVSILIFSSAVASFFFFLLF